MARPSVVLLTHPSTGGGVLARASNISAAVRALASSTQWDRPATLVVGPPGCPFVAAIGCFDSAMTARLWSLARQLEHSVVRYVGYDRAEEDCLLL
ncbi:MAG TPA: hypothetical protein VGL92_03745, partial [Acidimicrobiia bacterium]